jgi:hypothetical protein
MVTNLRKYETSVTVFSYIAKRNTWYNKMAAARNQYAAFGFIVITNAPLELGI